MIRGERVAAIVAAGGSGLRAGVAKQWLVLGGETVLRRVGAAARRLPGGRRARRGRAARRGGAAASRELRGLGQPARAVAGGAARADSVRNGLAAATGAAVVLVHDAARPFATPDLAVARRRGGGPRRRRARRAAGHGHREARRRGGRPPRVAETLDRRDALARADAAGLPPGAPPAGVRGGGRGGLGGDGRVRRSSSGSARR